MEDDLGHSETLALCEEWQRQLQNDECPASASPNRPLAAKEMPFGAVPVEDPRCSTPPRPHPARAAKVVSPPSPRPSLRRCGYNETLEVTLDERQELRFQTQDNSSFSLDERQELQLRAVELEQEFEAEDSVRVQVSPTSWLKIPKRAAKEHADLSAMVMEAREQALTKATETVDLLMRIILHANGPEVRQEARQIAEDWTEFVSGYFGAGVKK